MSEKRTRTTTADIQMAALGVHVDNHDEEKEKNDLIIDEIKSMERRLKIYIRKELKAAIKEK